MADFGAKDVQALRQSTGAGMMDAKKALVHNDGDPAAAAKWLREKGLASAAGRSDRDNVEGCVAVVEADGAGAIVELKCETDFVAKSDEFTGLADEIAAAVAAKGSDAADQFASRIDDMRLTLKENIELGQVHHIAPAEGAVLGVYKHVQAGRGVNGVLVAVAGATDEIANELTLHIAFAKPRYLSRDDVPEDDIETERTTLTEITRNEGKPEAALDKIVAGRLNGWFAEQCLLDQKFVRDEKQTVSQYLGDAAITRFAQVVIGG
ncbi:MAG TPA: translation elongation factor Ts [Acidimicrobiales bacterium]|jgi:elongation factor Ts